VLLSTSAIRYLLSSQFPPLDASVYRSQAIVDCVLCVNSGERFGSRRLGCEQSFECQKLFDRRLGVTSMMAFVLSIAKRNSKLTQQTFCCWYSAEPLKVRLHHSTIYGNFVCDIDLFPLIV
jgi:hypothetical protein